VKPSVWLWIAGCVREISVGSVQPVLRWNNFFTGLELLCPDISYLGNLLSGYMLPSCGV
jgi:hypothetical protein